MITQRKRVKYPRTVSEWQKHCRMRRCCLWMGRICKLLRPLGKQIADRQKRKHRDQLTNWRTIAVVHTGHNSGLGHGGSREGGEQRHWGWILVVEPTALTSELAVGIQWQGKRGWVPGLGLGKQHGWWWQVFMREVRRGRGRVFGMWKSSVLLDHIRIEIPPRSPV